MKARAEAQGESVNGLINRSIDETMERDDSIQRRNTMKHSLVVFVSLVAIIVILVGCGSGIPGLSKPEDAVDTVLAQDNLMKWISIIDEFAPDDDDLLSVLMADIITSSSFKSMLLDNIRSIDYSISDVSENGDTATVTALITHLDATPVMDRASQIFIDKVYTMDAIGTSIPDAEEDQIDMFLSMLKQSI